MRDYNRRVQSVPANVVARAGHFAAHEYFQLEPPVRTAAVPAVGR